VRVPGVSTAGARCNRLVELVDLYPTLCDVAQIDVPSNMEGTSFKPLLGNPDRDWKPAVFSQFHRTPRVSPDGKRYMGYSMVTDRYHYVEWRYWNDVKKTAGDLAAIELYDRHIDAEENTNIANLPANVAVIKHLARQLHSGWRSAIPTLVAR